VRTRAAIGGVALALSAGWSLANVGAVAGRIADAYGVSLAVVGLFTTALVLTHAAMQIPAGRFCDRFGARVVGAVGVAVILCASLAGLALREAWFAILVRLVTGLGLAGAFVGGADYVRATLRSPLAQGFYGAASMASAGLALALVPLWPGWQAPFATAAIVAAVSLVLVAIAAPAGGRRGESERTARIFDRRLVPLGVMHAASFGLSVVIGNWVGTLLERVGGESAHVAGVVGGLVLFLGVVSRPLGGRLVDRPAVVRASFVFGAFGIALLAVARPPALAVLAAAIVGLAAGIPFASALSGAQRLRPDAPGAAVGFVNLAATLVILVGTPLLGLTFSLPGGGRVGFVIAAVLCLAATASARKASRGSLV
jgi:AAHS family 3-hydroxyphenylpropionic acid transporter